MLSRILAALIIGFWLVMMTLLIRQEYFPDAASALRVPPETVWKRIFTADDPSHLKIYYLEDEIGGVDFRIDSFKPATPALSITASGARIERPEPAPEKHDLGEPAAEQSAYRMSLDLRIHLPQLEGAPRLYLLTRVFFDEAYHLQRFRSRLRGPGGIANFEVNFATRQLIIRSDVNGTPVEEILDFSEFKPENVAEAIHSPALLEQLRSMLGVDLPAATSSFKFQTITRRAPLKIAGQNVATYLVHLRVSNAIWIKIWVGMQGQILKLDTPFGITMIAQGIDDTPRGRVRSRL